MRRPEAEETALWRHAMRKVAPLRDRGRLSPQDSDRRHPARPQDSAGETPAVRDKPLPPERSMPPLGRAADVDRATADRVRRGQRQIEATLDLHGMTQAEAHRALGRFVAGSRALGRRVVLVVTGHGRISGGVLRQAVPRWLDEPELRAQVLMVSHARPQHGGDGALYLLLRKAS